MFDFIKFGPEDFAANPSFRRWKIYQIQEDTAFWEEWLRQHPDKIVAIELAERLLDDVFSSFDHLSEQELTLQMRRLSERMDELEDKPGRSVWNTGIVYRLLPIAAVLLLVMGLGGLYFLSRSEPAGSVRSIAEAKMLKRSNLSEHNQLVLLPDGSTVLLYPGSHLNYPEQFLKEERRISFSGEGFFEIAKDRAKPFYVVTDKMVAKVLGTSFSLRSSEDGMNASITVKSGRVAVYTLKEHEESPGKEAEVLLLPNEKVIFSDDSLQNPLMKSVASEREISSKVVQREPFLFRATPIGDVFAVLQREYGIRILFDERVMERCYLTAELADEPYFHKLDLICKTIGASYTRSKDDQITILSNGCQ